VELRADGVADALLDEAEQFGFDVVAGELERELLGALTVTRLREDPRSDITSVSTNALITRHI
jgi:hypothetical protein